MCKFDTLPIEKKLKALETMYLCRIFEEKIDALFSEKMMYGTTHLATGQEANHAGLCLALDESDWIVPTHRNHGFFLAKGGSSLALMAEMFGLRTGSSKGLGGSMHLADCESGVMCSTSIVGATAPLAVGMALALKYRTETGICAAVFGDGAANQGMVLESFNLASAWGVPVLFYCENNLYGMSTRSSRVTAGTIAGRAAAFGIKAVEIDGNDVCAVYEAACEAKAYMQKEHKPYLIESHTYRWSGHSKNDRRIYRDKEEERFWEEKCPIRRLEDRLTESKLAGASVFDAVKSRVAEKIEDEVRQCLAQAGAALSMDEAMSYVYPA